MPESPVLLLLLLLLLLLVGLVLSLLLLLLLCCNWVKQSCTTWMQCMGVEEEHEVHCLSLKCA